MSLRSLFLLEGQFDSRFRDDAMGEYEKLMQAIPTAHIEVVLGPTRILANNEVGYLIEGVIDIADVMIVFTTQQNGRPGGHHYKAWGDREKGVLVIYHKESNDRLIKRKLLASRNLLKDTNEAAEIILTRNFKVFVHEYTHEEDTDRMGSYKYPDTSVKPGDTPEEKLRKKKEYYNTEAELNAFLQTVFMDIQRSVSKFPKNWPLEDHAVFYDRARRFMEKNYPNFYKNITEENFRKFQKRVMQLWLDLRGSDPAR